MTQTAAMETIKLWPEGRDAVNLFIVSVYWNSSSKLQGIQIFADPSKGI